MSVRRIFVPLLLSLAVTLPAAAGEWTFWRGPDRNGVSTETGLVSSWSPEGENLLWKADFIGRSTPVVVDGRACFSGRVGEGIDRQEVVACRDAASGRKLWEHRFNVYNTTVPFNRVGWASLAADSETGYVYAHGVAGQLHGYDRDGKLVWSRFLAEQFGRASGYGGRTQTPQVYGDLLILSYVSVGWGDHAAPRHRYFAFDKRTGEVIWIATPGPGRMVKDMNTQSVPVVAEIGGRMLVVGGAADGWVYAMRLETGEKVWEFQLSKRGLNSSVLVDGNRVYAAHSEENIDEGTMGRVVCLDGSGTGDITKSGELWRLNEMAVGFSSPTLKDGRLYVIDNSANLHSVDAATGQVHWTHNLGTVGKGSAVWADGKLYVGEVNGRFHILKPGKTSCEQLDLDQVTVPDGRYAEIYGSPAIADGKIYFTSEGGAYCLGKKDAATGAGRQAAKSASRESGSPGPPIVVPAETVAMPGQAVRFRLRTVDAAGRLADAGKAQWSLKGLKGAVAADGSFTPDKDQPFQAGQIVAQVAQRRVTARIRVIQPLPWSEDFESVGDGETPSHWIAARTKFVVRDVDGNHVLAQLIRPRGLPRSYTYVGLDDWSNFTIQADVMGSRKGRRRTDVGLIAGGYTLNLMGNHQRIQVRSWEAERRMARQVDFAWEMDTWYTMKLRVEVHPDKARILGKVWPRGDDEPQTWTITVEDPYPIQGGSPGLVGFVPSEIYYDNLIVRKND